MKKLIGSLLVLIGTQGCANEGDVATEVVDHQEAATTGSSCPLFSPPAPGPSALPVPAELAQFDRLIGQFSCTGQSFEIPGFLTAHRMVGTLGFTRDLASQWIHGRYVEQRTAENPTPQATDDFLIFDLGTQKYRRVYFGSSGDEGRLVGDRPDAQGRSSWTGTMAVAGLEFPYVEDLTFSGSRRVEFDGKISLDGGATFSPVYKIRCTKR